MSNEAIWVNVIPNAKKTPDNQFGTSGKELPDWVAPPNVEAQAKGKNWTIGVKVGSAWYNQAGWNTKDDNGNLTGGITIKLSPNTPSSATSSGGQQSFTPQKTFAKNVAYGSNKPSGF